jgi:hypothetical protein
VTTSNTSDAVTIDRDLLPKELVKKLGLFKINLLPKTHPERGILNKLPLLTTRPPVPRIDRTYTNSVYKKTYPFAREKFDLCPPGQ